MLLCSKTRLIRLKLKVVYTVVDDFHQKSTYMTTEEWLKIVNQCDPLYLIEAGAPWNEYDIEIPELVEKATSCQSAEELGELIYEVFFKRFGDSTHQDKEKYLVAAEKAWIRLHPSDVK